MEINDLLNLEFEEAGFSRYDSKIHWNHHTKEMTITAFPLDKEIPTVIRMDCQFHTGVRFLVTHKKIDFMAPDSVDELRKWITFCLGQPDVIDQP